MTHTHVKFEQLATRLIDKNGMDVLLIRRGSVDETTSPPTTGPDTGFAFRGVQTQLDEMDTREGNTQIGDIKFLLSVGDTAPTKDDKIRALNTRYSIVHVERVAPAGDVLLWKVIARGGVPDFTSAIPGAPLVEDFTGLDIFEQAQLRNYTGTREDFIDRLISEVADPDENTFVAVGGISALRAVSFDGAGVSHTDPASADALAAMIGVSTSSSLAGGAAIIETDGEITDASWSWTPGDALFVGANGVLTDIAPTSIALRQVAVAVSSNTIRVDLGDLYILE